MKPISTLDVFLLTQDVQILDDASCIMVILIMMGLDFHWGTILWLGSLII
jgi:hypothetical protein